MSIALTRAAVSPQDAQDAPSEPGITGTYLRLLQTVRASQEPKWAVSHAVNAAAPLVEAGLLDAKTLARHLGQVAPSLRPREIKRIVRALI